MKVIILTVSDTVSDKTLVDFVQDLSNKVGEMIPLTILTGEQLTPKPMERPIFQQHVEDIIEVCGNNADDLTFSSNFWNQVHIGRITREIINEVVKKAEEYKGYVRSRRKAAVVVELCRIAAGILC